MSFLFSKDFLFGAACSACQIEAGCHEGGKGEDVGEHYCKLYPEKYGASDPEASADFYHRYPEDIQNMKELGLECFRFSISWSRIYPNGPEEACQAGIDYYSRVIDTLRAAGMVVFFDLFHCDLPYWVIEKGGIVDPAFSQWFYVYAKTCFEAFGDRVDYWCTVNEPSINCFAAYAYGTNAPFMKDMTLAIRASHNMLLSHYRVLKLYRSMGLKGKIGAVVHAVPVYGATPEEMDQQAAERKWAFYSGWWLDPMLKGEYPACLMDYPYLKDKMPPHYAEELRENFEPNDYIAVNYYGPSYAKYQENEKFNYESVERDLPMDDYGFRMYPQGLFDLVTDLSRRYPDKEIIISENGIGKKKWGNYEEELEDGYRVDYLREHLRALSRAMQTGAKVKAYLHWSIMDTNELYAGGYQYMFGLNQIRYDTLERVPRKSWYYYQSVIKNRRVD